MRGSEDEENGRAKVHSGAELWQARAREDQGGRRLRGVTGERKLGKAQGARLGAGHKEDLGYFGNQNEEPLKVLIRFGKNELREQHGNIYITECKIDSQWEFAIKHRELKLVLCDDLEGCDGVGGRSKVQEEGDICTPMADSH